MNKPAWLIKAEMCDGVCPIDLSKVNKTIGGYRVEHLSFVPKNSNGNYVTFPIKGTVILREKPLKTEYMIWDWFGSAGLPSKTYDLVLP